jgi:tetratricopeptide (TPR) repeat protein
MPLRRGSSRAAAVLPILVIALASGCASAPENGAALEPLPDYVGEDGCAACHPQEFEDWSGSHHDLAMQEATPSSVSGDFDATFTHLGVAYRFFEDGDRFFVNTEGPDGETADFPIAYTFGFDPLQQYLIEFPGGRLQALSVAWDLDGERWFHLYPDERIPPDDPLHWTGPYQNWNTMCAECHSTNLRKNFDPESGTYDTRWDAIDVGCQSCHGPGADHLGWARGEGVERGDPAGLGLVVDLAGTDPVDQVETCAPCHSRRRPVSVSDRVGEPYLDHFLPELLREDLYHADGQIQGEVYVYGSFVQSRMYAEGVGCSDCHDPHSLDLWVGGNATCERCHNPDGPMDRFPTLVPGDYGSPAHHFHPVDSPGARCVNCHMVERTYMVVDPRRDHSFRTPRPDLSVRLGTPNACNDCHSDETFQWAADAVAGWYGPPAIATPHYGEILSAGRAGASDALEDLSALARDEESPMIVRATALELAARYGEPAWPVLLEMLADSEPLLRVTALGGLESSGVQNLADPVVGLLGDPLRAVRLEAARLLAPLAPDAIPVADRELLDDLLVEYESVQLSMADMAPAHLNLGVLHAAAGSIDRAVSDYETALRLQPDFTPASLNLATLFNRIGRNGDARRVLRDAIARHPEEGELHYSMGLLLAEMGQFNGAVESLQRGVELLPGRARVRYNLGLALQRLDRRSEAEAALDEAYRLDPADPSILQARAAIYAQDERWDEALRAAEDLVDLLPEDAAARQFLDSIRRASGRR